MQDREQHIERTADRLAVALFLSAIALPAVLAIPRAPREPGEGGRGAQQVEGEQRRAAKLPSLPSDAAGLEAYPEAFDRWYADAFGLRGKLVRWHNVLFWLALGKTSSEKMVRGEQGWLFYRQRRALESSLGAIPLTPAELEDWCEVLEARRDWCAKRGIQYLFVSAPTKVQIYPEYLPDEWKRVGPSRLDQLHEHLALVSDVPQLDLRPALLDEKARGDRPDEQDWLYYPLGTHWASRGSVVAYREIVRALSQGVLAGTAIPDLEDFRRRRGPGPGDSWAERLYLDDFLHQTAWLLRSPGPTLERSPIPLVRLAQRFEQPQAPDLPRLVLYHDSFAEHVKPLLGRHFSRASCYWSMRWQTARLIEERPDVVIDFMVERMLHLARPGWLRLYDQERLAALFAAGAGERVIDPLAEDSGLSVVGDHLARAQGESLVLRRRGGWELFDLRELRPPPGFDFVLELDLESPEATTLEFVYPGADQPPQYKRGRGPRVHLEPGRQTVYVLIERDHLGFTGSAVVRVGAAPGASRWVVNRVRVRGTAVPLP